ncbi:photosynthetic NDH subunit of subcomplex B 5, chloroplastic [Andrographis paniculata]|uniref:photosynthetic NDH subunit of subcomplex B 5, chloroplastic n=1 Tax=Andrographis paniculata TaxID=175694 RepID=UPI0021E87033|nr:photosynthetic NDH subunit of subcomplex B 5, chloroplastic [Andrographis paniculata]
MAGSSSTIAVLQTNSIPKSFSHDKSSELHQTKRRSFTARIRHSTSPRIGVHFGRRNPTKLSAGLTEIEPDLNEDPRDVWATNGIDAEDFVYGIYDGHHTFFESDDKASFWELVSKDYWAVGPPTGFQGVMSWLFPPAIAAGMYFNAPGEYLYIGAAVFTVIFCAIEMNKPSEPHNFEPEIYNMERGARDKLIADYNTMDKWEFNEKYGDVWDFTVQKDDIAKR